jgi:HEAT repeat protein
LQTMVMASLNDENRGVRFVAAMLVGREKLCDVRPLIEKMLEDPSDSVRAAAIYALSACDGAVNPTPLAEMVSSSSPEVRGNAYVVLGLLGEASAIPLIRSGLGQGLGLVDPVRVRLVDLQGAAALVRLGDEREIEPIRAALFAPTEQSELTALAIQLVSQLHDEGARQMLVRLVEAPMRESRPPEIRLAAAEAIAVLGALEAAPMIRLANEYIENPRSEIRAQVASLLGEVNDATARALLSDLMKDPDPIVRVAAAGSTLKLGVDERTATASVH